MLESLVHDLRYGVRIARSSPGFVVTAAISLAIGIGANTTIFSVANALLLRPLPGLAEPSALVDIGRTQGGQGFDTSSFPNYQDFRARTTTLEGVYAVRLEPLPMSLSENGVAERIYGTVVTANYFTVLGTRPHLGRLLSEDDDRTEGGSPVAVISHELWERRFGADASIVGRPVTLNGLPFTIVGVAPRGFQGTTLLKPDLWVPMSMLAQASPRMSANLKTSRAAVWLVMGGRLKHGVTAAQANAEASAIAAALEQEYPRENRGKGLRIAPSALVPGRIDMVGAFIGLLMAIVGLVLLIACVNVSGMLLARAAARRREIAVRLAIGAGRGRLIRQLLTETALLFALGGAAGILMTNWLTSLLLGVLPQLPVPLAVEIGTDWRVATFALAISFGSAVIAGLAPAVQASRADLVPALRSEGLDSAPARLRLRNALVVGQVTLSLVLIVAAGLFLRALQHASGVDPGFDQNQVEVVSLDLSLAGYREGNGERFMRDLLERTRALPGVESASAAVDLPLDGGRFGLGGVRVPGATPPPGRDSFNADWNVVEPGYFRTLRLPLIRGRDFADTDSRGTQRVAIVNEAFASLVWPGQDPIGRQFEQQHPDGAQVWTVVGVASNAKLVSLEGQPGPFIYLPLAQQFIERTNLVVRSSTGRTLIPDVRAIVRAMNPHLPVTEALALDQITALSLIPQRIAAAVAASLGVVGLLLAVVGIYGVTSYAVSRRTREIGIRMALGADSIDVITLVLRQGAVLAGIGVALGLAIAAAASGALKGLLLGVSALDPLTFGGACLLFAAVTLVASYIPARRATRVAPIAALRRE
jgi:predicted permease